MSKSIATVVTLTAALLAVAVPVALAIVLSNRQAHEAQMALLTTYAREVMHRSESTTEQALASMQALDAAHSADACSDSNLAIMRRFDLASSYLQAVGHAVGDTLECSSLGRDAGALPLGPVDWITPMNVKVRINVKFPFDPVTTYLVLENANGFAAVINKDLPLDITTNEQEVTLGDFATYNGRLYTGHGFYDRSWLGAPVSTLPPRQTVTTFVDRGYVVVRSDRYYVAAIAALPVSYMLAQTRTTTQILLAAGLLAGIALALITLHLARLQMAMPAVIRTALKRREFFLHYQPIVNLRTREWVGAEALIRWRRRGVAAVRWCARTRSFMSPRMPA